MIEPPTLPAYETFVNHSTYWLVWCEHCRDWHRHGSDETSPYWWIENRQWVGLRESPENHVECLNDKPTSKVGRPMTDDSKVTIDRIEMGTGWVAFQPGNNLPKPAKLQAYVNRSFCKITVANHVWFD